MKVKLHRVNNNVHFRAFNGEGPTIDIDGSPAIGGEGQGFRPMETVLAAHAGCTVMDLVPILEKQRQRVDDVRVGIDGTRGEGNPSPFTAIHIHYDLEGQIEVEKARKALDLAVYKYCSVGEMLKHSATITYSFTVNGVAG